MTTESVIRNFVLEELKFTGARDDLTADYPLLGSGTLDSLGLVSLVTFLESSCGIVIEEEDLLPENFETIGSITSFVESRQES
jgi:acyl carrier protein